MEDNRTHGANVPIVAEQADRAGNDCLQDNAGDDQLQDTTISQHSHEEQECSMASEIGPSPDYGGMLNCTQSEFTEQNNLQNNLIIGLGAKCLYSRSELFA